jgi:predicted DCC family thiol-disulfide oxidoreductase YuxK
MTLPGGGDASAGPVLIYDGVCGFCNGAVRFILRHESRHDLRFAPLQGVYGERIRKNHPAVAEVDSVVWVEGEGPDERALIRSDAAFRVVSYLGGLWRLLHVFRLVPRVVRDFFYDGFARRRYGWFGKYDSCPIPPPEVRARFLG